MPHAFHKLWIHLIWGTKNRHPYLTGEIRNEVLFHIKGEARKKGIHLDTLNGTADHVHALLGLDPDQSIARIVNDLKGESSHWINERKLVKAHFAWQDGYSAYSYGESQVAKVREYIRDQERRHKKMSFQEELARFLKRFNVEPGRPFTAFRTDGCGYVSFPDVNVWATDKRPLAKCVFVINSPDLQVWG